MKNGNRDVPSIPWTSARASTLSNSARSVLYLQTKISSRSAASASASTNEVVPQDRRRDEATARESGGEPWLRSWDQRRGDQIQCSLSDNLICLGHKLGGVGAC